ncbi:MAG: hypothetical protein K8T10_01720 [Candidatus Eremiobacteraeota bacterium]|nr:hypothetical protein [Candidatus Eremiobacteraeota bacterium]
MDFDIFASLRSAIGIECPECGEINPSTEDYCLSCGSPLPEEDEEEPSLSIVQEVGFSDATGDGELAGHLLKNIPIDTKENLRIVKEIMDRAQKGEIQYDEYIDIVNKVFETAKKAMDKYNSDSAKNSFALLPGEKQRLANKLTGQISKFYSGCKRMLEYDGGADGSHAIKGAGNIENALKGIDEIRKKLK